MKKFLLKDKLTLLVTTKKLVRKRIQVKTTNMTKTSINKIKFASLNEKRYYGSEGIVSLPFSHHLLNEVR